MNLPKTFSKLKAAGLPKISAKFSKLSSGNKLSSFSFKKPLIPKNKSLKPFDFSKFTKKAKLPAPKKVAILKKAIKKNVGF